MELIDKSAVVAEIEKRLSLLEGGTGHPEVVKQVEGVIKGYKSILSLLDTLEVKEFDLEEEIANWWNDHYAGIKKDYTFEGYTGHYIENSTLIEIIKHFYVLGLKTKGE